MAVNLAEAIARQTGQRVGVLDLDLQLGDTAVLLGFVPEYTIADAAASVGASGAGAAAEPDVVRPNGVFVLPAPLRPEEADEITADQIRTVLTVMSHTFDYVVVDTPPPISDAVAAALDLSTLVLLLTTQEVLALRRTKVAVQMLRTWGYNEDKVKLVVNHAYSTNGATTADIEAGLEYKIFWQRAQRHGRAHRPARGPAVRAGLSQLARRQEPQRPGPRRLRSGSQVKGPGQALAAGRGDPAWKAEVG